VVAQGPLAVPIWIYRNQHPLLRVSTFSWRSLHDRSGPLGRVTAAHGAPLDGPGEPGYRNHGGTSLKVGLMRLKVRWGARDVPLLF
jgi:hypothetical protein